jgi:hypothetical protein
VNFLRDFILPVSPFDDFQGLTGCLKIGVHSSMSLLFVLRVVDFSLCRKLDFVRILRRTCRLPLESVSVSLIWSPP